MFRLSAQRVRLVYEMLIDNGIPPARLSYKGMGNAEMLFPELNSNEERVKNMRVEVLICK